MTKHIFSVDHRSVVGRKVGQLRATGIVPANIFGKKIDSRGIQISAKNFQKLIKEVGESTLLYLQLDGSKEELPVLIRETVYHPVTGALQHVSFQQVSLKEKTSATIPLILHGEAPAEAQKLGIMVQQLDEIEVEALPTDIPENITLDVSSLTEVGSAILVKDIRVDTTKLTLMTDPETIIVQISPLAKEEVAEAQAPEPAEGEVPAASPSQADGESAAAPAAASEK